MIRTLVFALLYVAIRSTSVTRRFPHLYEGFQSWDYFNQTRIDLISNQTFSGWEGNDSEWPVEKR